MSGIKTQDAFQAQPLIEAHNLEKTFSTGGLFGGRSAGRVKAVNDVSLSVFPGQTLGIVGESGCGKSTLIRLLLYLIRPSAGRVLFLGKDLSALPKKELRKLRRNIQIVFQDPFASLSPRQKIGDALAEPFLIHRLGSRKEALERAKELLSEVGLNQDSLEKFPHEFSGGQRQRICIARALAVNPKVLVCDECVSALDVSVQAQIINLLMKIQRETNIAMVFVSHDLRVVRHISMDIAVMHQGRIVEAAEKKELFQNPLHPYTKALLSAVPSPDPEHRRQRTILTAEKNSDAVLGCPFAGSCPMARAECALTPPILEDGGTGHFVRCPVALAEISKSRL